MLAIVGGTGRLPGLVIEALVAQGDAPVLAELHGHPIEGRGDLPVLPFRLEQLGTLIADLVARGVTRVCFAGAVRRPTFDPSLVDAATAPLLPRIAAALGGGDDSALRAVATLFQEAGMTPVAAHELRADLLPEPGELGRHTPADTHAHDAERAMGVVAALSDQDIGQGCVVSRGQVLAVEAFPGTDWMLRSLTGEGAHDGPRGGILFKAPKAGQDRRFDMPAIGVDTVRAAQAAGLDGIVLAAGGVMVLDAPAVIAAADAAGLFLWVRAA